MSTPHCLCYVAKSTLIHSQFHIAKSSTPMASVLLKCSQFHIPKLSTPHCQELHCQLTKLTSFFFFCVALMFSHCPLRIFNIWPNAENSILGCPNKIFVVFFFLLTYLVHLPLIHNATYHLGYLLKNPHGLLTYASTYLLCT